MLLMRCSRGKDQNEVWVECRLLLLEGMEPTASKDSRIQQRGEQSRSLEDYRRQRAFPHIADYYNFRINNRILVSKIINPRRDKTIMESLLHAHPKYSLTHHKNIGPRNQVRKNNTSTFTCFRKTEDVSGDMEGGANPRNTSKTNQHLKTIRNDNLEEQHGLEESRKNKMGGDGEHPETPPTLDHSPRNQFMGKIVKNVGQGALELSQSVVNCDLSFSCTLTAGFICKNGSPQGIVAGAKSKIKRIHRPYPNRQFQSKENYSLRVEDVSAC